MYVSMCSLLLLQLAGQITAGRRKEFKKKIGRQRKSIFIHHSEALHWQVSDGTEFCGTEEEKQRKTRVSGSSYSLWRILRVAETGETNLRVFSLSFENLLSTYPSP